MKVGSLSSGYGGLDIAIEAVFPDAHPAWFCEWDDAPSKILAHHWPDVPNLRDVSSVDWEAVQPVDVITGGFPCQDVSHAGRRQGLIRDGEGRTRSGLWGQMLRAIDTIRPALVVAENVRGLLSATADSDVEPCPWCMGDAGASPMRALGAVLADLADIGYDAAWCGLRAADVGAPHGRFRVFILAHPADADRDILGQLPGAPPEQEARADEGDRPADPRGGRGAELTLLATPHQARDYKEVPGDGFNTAYLARDVALLPTPVVSDAENAGSPPGSTYRGRPLTDVTTRDHLLQTPSVADAMGGHLSRSGARSDELLLPGQAKAMSDTGWGDYAPAIAWWESVIGRSAPTPTEPGAKGNPRLSPRFVEWLMGLPAGHVTAPAIGLTRNQQLKALGNGVVPQQAAAALGHLLEVERAA